MAIKKKAWWKRIPSQKIHRLPDGDVVCSDALAFLQGLRKDIADVIFLDPPFNLGKQYGTSSPNTDRRKENEYYDYMTLVLEQCIEILREGAALYLYHLPRWAMKFGHVLQTPLQFRHWIAISMKNGFVRGKFLYPAHYALLYFTKGNPFAFARPKVLPLTCPHCGEYVKDYGGYKKYIKKGINLGDIWDDVSPVRHNKYKNRTSNELPLVIPQRALQISGKRGGLVIDPFAGSGTTLIAARQQGMRFVACDCEPEYCDLIKKRLSKLRCSDTCRKGQTNDATKTNR